MKNINLILLVVLVGFTGCNSNEDMTTNTVSTIFKSKSEKITFMEKYYSPKFPYEDVEYHIVYHDNDSGRGVPGPSDWSMLFAFKLDSKETQRIRASDESQEISINVWSHFLPKNKKWNLDGPKQYSGNDVLIEQNNILLKKISTFSND